jgi:tRNA uridine 5-carboxymethylaminomethyl modification enzyme
MLRSTRLAPKQMPEPLISRLFPEGGIRDLTLAEILKRPDMGFSDIAPLLAEAGNIDADVAQQVEISTKYQGYIDRQQEQVERQRGYESTRLPDGIDYADIPGLSSEVRQKLTKQRPETIGQASRISGITPAAISLLLVYLKRRGGRERIA